MNKLNLLLAIFFTTLLSVSSVAQFTLSGEMRSKAMFLDGYKELLNDNKYPYALVIQRSRLNFDYIKENLTVGLSIQDVRAWGQDAYTSTNNNIGVFEAYVKYAFCKNMAVKFGRQSLKYDDERIIGAVNWRDQGATHDIAVLQFSNDEKAVKADIGLAVNNPANYQNYLSEYTNKNYKYLSYLWVNKKFMNKKLDISVLSIADVNQKPLTVYNYNTRYSNGTYINYKNDKINMAASFYYQGGKLADGKTVNANFYSLKAGYKFHKMIEMTLGYDHYSGTDFSDTSNVKKESTTFDKLYGTGHGYLGYMDFFNGNSSDITKGAGINDLFVKANFILNEKHNVEATYHLFNLDKAYFLQPKQASKKYDKALGSEIDLMYTYKQSKTINMSLGYSVYLPSETMENLHNFKKGESNFAQFAYLLLTIKPVFFMSKE